MEYHPEYCSYGSAVLQQGPPHTPCSKPCYPTLNPQTPSKFLENLIGSERHELWLPSRLQRPVATCTARDFATHESCATLQMQIPEPNQEPGALLRADIYALDASIGRAQGSGLYTSNGVC